MDARLETDMRRAMSSGSVNRATVAFLEGRLASCQDQLVSAGDNTYKQIQGRAQELKELIKFITLAREP